MAPCSSTPSSPASRARRAPSAKYCDDLPDLGDGHPLAAEAVDRIRLVGGAQALIGYSMPLMSRCRPQWLSCMMNLQSCSCTASPSARQNGMSRVVVDHRVVGHDAAAQVHRHERRDDGADAAPGELGLPVDARLVAGAVVVVEAARDVRPEDPVLDGQVPELQRLEDDVAGMPLIPQNVFRNSMSAHLSASGSCEPKVCPVENEVGRLVVAAASGGSRLSSEKRFSSELVPDDVRQPRRIDAGDVVDRRAGGNAHLACGAADLSRSCRPSSPESTARQAGVRARASSACRR